MSKPIETLSGPDAAAFQTAISPSVLAVLNTLGITPSSFEAMVAAAEAELDASLADAQASLDADKTASANSATAAAANAAAALAAPLDAERRGKVVGNNIFDPTRVTVGSGIRVSDGALIAGIGANYAASDFIRVGSSDFIATLDALNGPNATYGIAFYTAANAANFVSGSGAVSIAAGANLATPATANFVRFTVPVTLLWQTDVVRGATAPTTFRAFETTDTFNARAAVMALLFSAIGLPGNLFDKRNIITGEYFNAAGATQSSAAFAKSNTFAVEPSKPYVCNKSSPANVYSVWKDSGGNVAGAPFLITAGVAFTSPKTAATLTIGYQISQTDPRFGTGVDTKQLLVVVPGTALPAAFYSFGVVDAATGDVISRKAARRNQPKKLDLLERSNIVDGQLLASSGTSSASPAYFRVDAVPLTPDKGVACNFDFSVASPGFGWNWYGADGTRIGCAAVTGAVATTATGEFTLDVTNVGTAGPMTVGLPIAATGIPARSWVASVPASGPGTIGQYTFANAANAPATASGSVSVAGGGFLAGIAVMPIAGAVTGAVSATTAARYKLVISDENITGAIVGGGAAYSAPGFLGNKDLRRKTPYVSLNFGGFGDSKTADAGGNNAFWATLEDHLRANLVLTGGGSGRKVFQRLDGAGGGTYQRGPSTPLTQADFVSLAMSLCIISDLTNDFGLRNLSAGATTNPALVWPVRDCTVLGALGDSWTPTTFTAGLTAGQVTISSPTVTRGTLQAGMPLRGTGIDTTCTLVDAGGGAWTLSTPAVGTGSFSTTIQGGTFYADQKYTLVDRILPWMEASDAVSPTVVMIGADQRFDDILYHGQTGATPGNPINGRGLKLTDYIDAAEIVARSVGVPFYNSHRNLGINAANYAKMFSDGLHDLLLCYETRKGPKLGRWINSLT